MTPEERYAEWLIAQVEAGRLSPDAAQAELRQFTTELLAAHAAPPTDATPTGADADGPTDLQLAARLLIEGGERPDRAFERVVSEPGIVGEMAGEIEARREWLGRVEADNREREHEASDEGRQQKAAQALRDEHERDNKLAAARAYVKRHHEELGLPTDAHNALPDEDLLHVAGFETRRARDAGADDVAANVRAATASDEGDQ